LQQHCQQCCSLRQDKRLTAGIRRQKAGNSSRVLGLLPLLLPLLLLLLLLLKIMARV
jgi:hypothetical protein